MLGYPGETDEQFRNTMDYVAHTRFDAAFMFAYSPRPGTKAADMPDQVPQEVKVARLNALIDLQNRISARKCQACVGDVVEVLVEGPSSRNAAMLSGYTRTLRMVHFPGATEVTPPGSLVRVEVEEGGLTGFLGTPT
jgi:tRNA-2-methylthio-N6-dimethylallyladenosine synthase